jgi:3-deoxy-D-manno-octulosonic-acid transferase
MSPPALALYGAAMRALEPLAPALLRRRAASGKEDLTRLPERLGRPTLSRPPRPLIWLHGASVGESLSLLPLIERLRSERPGATLLVTSVTVTSAELLARRLPPGVLHQYAPLDLPDAAERFLQHWRPDLVIFVESELWPGLLLRARAKGARLALLSARLSASSARGWSRAPSSAREVLTAFDLILTQDDDTAARLARLGARDHGRWTSSVSASRCRSTKPPCAESGPPRQGGP